MLKMLLILSIFTTFSFARVVGGIAMLVNGDPITTYELKSFARKNGISMNDAVNSLIQQKLELQEAAKLGISANSLEIDNEMLKLAKKNGLSLDAFKKEVAREGKSLSELQENIRKKIIKDKLYQAILSSSLEKPTEDDLKRFYDLHSKELNAPTKVDVIQYVSLDKERLKTKLRTPAFPIDQVSEGRTSVPLNAVPPQLAEVLLKTKKGHYTPILNIGQGRYVAFMVLKKHQKHITYESIKPKLFGAYVNERQQAKLIEFFEKKKSEANIKVIRKPN